MHGWHRGVERRIEDLARCLGSYPTPPTPEETARRLGLAGASLEGREPEPGLAESERDLFEEIRRYAPVFQELIEEGALDSYLAGDDHDHGGNGGEEAVWSP